MRPALSAAEPASRPNIVLVMADDQGWGETGYNGHPILKTPHLDAMAAAGLRLDRFYAGAPVCSPTRAAVLTGRNCQRAGVPEHGYALRHQEITLPQLLADAGYQTAHFGKWHLDGLRGPGVPILASDPFHPGTFGFSHWLSVTNFYDRDPLLSLEGEFVGYLGDSSDVIIDQALTHIRQQAGNDQPFFDVIWYGTPHSPFRASQDDRRAFSDLDENSQHHYGELVALDRSLGTLRAGLRQLGLQENTLLWYCSDNGGLPKIEPPTTGGLRGHKGTIFEGGLRVPCVMEWPGTIQPRRSSYPASVMDILPTVLELAGVEYPEPQRPRDGISLTKLFHPDAEGADAERDQPICFRYRGAAAIVDNDWKLLSQNVAQGQFQLYDLSRDVAEANDAAAAAPERAKSLETKLQDWLASVDASIAGKDYPSGTVDANHPQPSYWVDHPDYQPYLDRWQSRWQYGDWIRRRR
ncbi:sulfatase-like hydrolase/transferase [Roseiconus nitratireducens]|uniref:Sulfatase-like hydrolase/transferase n=2 Tax=Roseiconus nitratireducens TaxID=2605748 RepID=A0A5M6DAU8_9BACT|nr:sulfatase-like hydrolase/transferase [Roseiconus nitratireducens]